MRSRALGYSAIAVLVIVLIAAIAVLRFQVPRPVLRVDSLISTGGLVTDVQLSADGNQLLYARMEENQRFHLYVKPVGTAPPRRLTDDQDPNHGERTAQWIPGDNGISFLRRVNGGDPALFVVPSTGGLPRKLMDFHGDGVQGYVWMPDARSVIVSVAAAEKPASLYKIDVASGIRTLLTHPPSTLLNTRPAISGDYEPRISPDGKTIVFGRALSSRVVLMIMPAAGGEPRELAGALPLATSDSRAPGVAGISGTFTWTADGREILFLATETGAPSPMLYRVRVPEGSLLVYLS